MAEPALALRDHPQIIDLISVLEQNGLQKQKEEVQALVGYIDGMEEKLSQMMDEMKEMRLEVGKLHDKGIRARCSQLVDTVEGKVRQTKVMVSTTKENLISSAKQMVQTFREKGRSALYHRERALRPVPCSTGPAYPLGSFPDGTGLCPCGKKHGAACREAGRYAGGTAPGGRPHQKRRACPCGKGTPGKQGIICG